MHILLKVFRLHFNMKYFLKKHYFPSHKNLKVSKSITSHFMELSISKLPKFSSTITITPIKKYGLKIFETKKFNFTF